MFKIGKNERVVTAWAESFAGPGWANQLVMVLVEDENKKLRIDSIQPEDQTEIMMWLFKATEELTDNMKSAVNLMLNKKKNRRT